MKKGSSDNDRPSEDAPAYQVLARKYRPTTFSELIGQEAMVRTLANAIAAGRLAHAFVLTGVRGVGKTTTARIIARALNCIGADGKGGPTAEPCGVCANCTAIAEDRHVDVMEMDAASRTGVDDIRELIDGVRYRPTTARYKIYIVDEVHMLSKNAFNALLKTLEEPPPHVKFIFATTEIRKVPVTVLSRCQRFDLRRIDNETLEAHFAAIATKEGVEIQPGAVRLIARAADGSVRDGLSLLDQAISRAAGAAVTEDETRAMLGLADRTLTFDLLDAVMRGRMADALDALAAQYRAGADPAQTLEDMLELTHWLTRVKIVPTVADDPAVPELERGRGREMAAALSMSALARAWQMLLKGLGEVRNAPSPIAAAEMVLVRLGHAAELPTPEEAVRALGRSDGGDVAGPAPNRAGGAAPGPSGGGNGGARASRGGAQPAVESGHPADAEAPRAQAMPAPTSFAEVVALADEHREQVLRANLVNHCHLVRFEPGRIELRLSESAPRDVPQRLIGFLNKTTGRPWFVTVSGEDGEPTLQAQRNERNRQIKEEVARHPLIQAVMATFPDANIETIREPMPAAGEGASNGTDDAHLSGEDDDGPI